jgi:hypothetical protein
VELVEDMLFAELVKAEGGWLWHCGRIGNRLEATSGYWLSGFVVEKSKGMMENIGVVAVHIALCNSLLWMMIFVEVHWSLAPSFSQTQGMLGSLLCGGWYRCHGTCSMEA